MQELGASRCDADLTSSPVLTSDIIFNRLRTHLTVRKISGEIEGIRDFRQDWSIR